jgi:transcriptional regulator with XRE-family HTH domain
MTRPRANTPAIAIRILLGRRIQELRRAKELTQEQLAETVKLSRRQLQRIESGDSNVRIDDVAAVARALGVELAALVTAPAEVAPRIIGRPRKA